MSPSGLSLLGLSQQRKARFPRVATVSSVLTPESRRCLQNLAVYKPPPRDPALVYPLSRSAAVLVALFVGRSGNLYVMLSRRAETLRTFPGDTSLPGGRYEPGDKNLEDTARREAFEEIGLPRDRHRIPLLCTLEPFPTGNHLLVTPVVVLILDPDIRPILNEPEVSALFSHPLRSFLSRTAPFGVRHEPHSAPHPNTPNHVEASSKPYLRALPANGTHARESSIPDSPPEALQEAKSQQRDAEPTVALSARAEASRASSQGWKRSSLDSSDAPKREYYSYKDIPWGQSLVRMHRFLTGREELGVKPVYGLTATICLHVASIGYARPPEFPMYAPSEKRLSERVAHVLRNDSVFSQAVEQERKDAEDRFRTRPDSQYNSNGRAQEPHNGLRTRSKL